MDTVNLAEQKLLLFQKILSIENENIIDKLFILVDKFTKNKQLADIDADIENIDIGVLSFDEWNKLFMEDRNLSEYIPEYDMTLRDYRMKIYSAEKGKSYPINQFLKKLENYVQ